MATNLLTVAIGTVPSNNDPRIKMVSESLDRINDYCQYTKRWADVGDKLVTAHSVITYKFSLLVMLNDLERMARKQCAKIDSTTLLTLYVLEINSGVSHSLAANSVAQNPRALTVKWSKK